MKRKHQLQQGEDGADAPVHKAAKKGGAGVPKQLAGKAGPAPSALPVSAAAPGPSSVAAAAAANAFKNKEKVLVLSTRGVTFRYRHLMEDVINLLPHSKKESKLDTKSDRGVINEVADLKNCSSVLFFEVRKRQDLYLWMAKSPDGPSIKFHVTNVHTMAEVKLSGNHLKGARPVLSFDASFDAEPHTQLIKEMLAQVFATPKKHHKSKPFFDHVLSFTIADGRVWFRNYQIIVPLDKKRPDAEAASLVEVGPRFCLNPIKVFAGSFGGATLYENPTYTSPNTIRTMIKRKQAGRYTNKVMQRDRRQEHVASNPAPRDPLDGLWKGGDDGDGGDGGDE